jgi:hypothetical protein
MQIPVIPDIHKAVYAAVVDPTHKLDMSDWHKCETTHCRAGWVVHLAGAPGYELEKRTSTLFAAQQIYKASGYLINPCRFYDRTDEALADMKRLAESEVAFDQFKQRVFAICEAVKPGCYAAVELAAFSGQPHIWRISTDAWPYGPDEYGSVRDVWHCNGRTPEEALAKLEQEASRFQCDPEYLRQVAEAMGL